MTLRGAEKFLTWKKTKKSDVWSDFVMWVRPSTFQLPLVMNHQLNIITPHLNISFQVISTCYRPMCII